jgi:hypothetical protein
MASLAAAASLTLSKVTKPKPRERVGFSLEVESGELLLHAASECRSPVHGDEGVEHFTVPAERVDQDVLVCVPGEIADVAGGTGEGPNKSSKNRIGMFGMGSATTEEEEGMGETTGHRREKVKKKGSLQLGCGNTAAG